MARVVAAHEAALGAVVAERMPVSLVSLLPRQLPRLRLENGAPRLHHDGDVIEELEYGVPVAFILLLRFALRCTAMLLLIALIAVPEILDNHRRSGQRHDCREGVRELSALRLLSQPPLHS